MRLHPVYRDNRGSSTQSVEIQASRESTPSGGSEAYVPQRGRRRSCSASLGKYPTHSAAPPTAMVTTFRQAAPSPRPRGRRIAARLAPNPDDVPPARGPGVQGRGMGLMTPLEDGLRRVDSLVTDENVLPDALLLQKLGLIDAVHVAMQVGPFTVEAMCNPGRDDDPGAVLLDGL